MATIAAGSSATVTIPVGQSLLLTNSWGRMSYGPGNQFGTIKEFYRGSKVGPFRAPTDITLYVDGAAPTLTYTLSGPISSAYYDPASGIVATPGGVPVSAYSASAPSQARLMRSPSRFGGPHARIWKGIAQAGAGFANSTWHQIGKAPNGTFSRIRICLRNFETGTTAIAGGVVASTNTATTDAQRIVSSNGTTVTGNSATGWVQVTWSGATTVTLPARISATVPSVTWSDWMDCRSVDAIDGSALPYYLARVYTVVTPYSYMSSDQQGIDVPADDRYFFSYRQVVDGVTTPASFTATAQNTLTPVCGVEFQSALRSVNVLTIGDSITCNSGATWGFVGWAQIMANNLKQSGWPISLANLGFPGMNSTDFLAYGKAEITNSAPDYAFYSVHTPNDNGGGSSVFTQTDADNQFAKAADFITFCAKTPNTSPVLVFIAPNDGFDTFTDSLRRALIAKCKALGGYVLDMTPALATATFPQRYIAALKLDNLHPNEAGCQAAGQLAAAWFASVLSQSIA